MARTVHPGADAAAPRATPGRRRFPGIDEATGPGRHRRTATRYRPAGKKAGPLKRAARQTHLSRWCPPGRASRTAVAPNQTEHAERRPALANKVAQRAKLCTKNAGHAMPSADHQRCRRRATPACGALCAGRGGHLSRHSRNATTPTNRRSKKQSHCASEPAPVLRIPTPESQITSYTASNTPC